MNSLKYMQTDGKWSGLPFPKGKCTIGNSGCGEVAIANMLIEMNQYANYTPATIQPYCKQYAASNCDGYTWEGVPKTMKHYGMTEVKECTTMKPLWDEMAKGNRLAFLIMGNRKAGKKKVVWTTGGHCICAVAYKYEGGKHWLYVKDSYSNSKLRNEWITYEDNMANDIIKIWVGKMNGTPTPKPMPGRLEINGIGDANTIITAQKVFGTKESGKIAGQVEVQHQFYPSVISVVFDKGTGSALVKAIQKWCGAEQDGIWGKGTSACMQKKLRDLGFFDNPKETIDGYFGVKSMKAFQRFLNTKIEPTPTPPTPTPTPDPDPKPEPTPTPTVIEHYKGEYPNPKKYLEYGDKGTEVTKLQKYIDWMFDGAFVKECGKADGKYGKNTLKWAKKMQKKLGFSDKESNGEVGKKTIAKMKAYGKPVKPTPTPPTPPTPSKDYKVIDISFNQKNVDFNKVKADGIGGVIIRCGFRGYVTAKLQEDSQYQNHIKGASKAGLPIGVYFFTQAINEKEGRAEADYAISLVEKMGIPLSYPIGIDTEHQSKEDKDDPEPRANNISKTERTEAIKGFCERCLERGYRPMIYASTEWFKSKLDMSKLPYDIWCAQWASKCEYKGDIVMWQYSSKGNVKGISGAVDMNHCYIQPTPNPSKSEPAPQPQPTTTPTTAPTTTASASKIGQACKDYDKKAGDSSGKEVVKSNFTYSSSSTSPYNWTYVFRPKDSAKAEKAATMCEKAIANNAIGYNSHGETAYGKDKAMTKLAKAVNYDLSKITTKCGLSCGDLICLCNHYAGLSTCYIGSALPLAKKLKSNSKFDCLSYKKGMALKRGDVLITAHSNGKNNHVAMVL